MQEIKSNLWVRIILPPAEFNGHIQTEPIIVKARRDGRRWHLKLNHLGKDKDGFNAVDETLDNAILLLRRKVAMRFDPYDLVMSKQVQGSLSLANQREHEILSRFIQRREKVMENLLCLYLVNKGLSYPNISKV